MSNNIALTHLDCNYNAITSLNVGNSTALTTLICDRNGLTSLDVSKNTALTGLWAQRNQFSAAGLNALFGTLHVNASTKTIRIRDNPSTATCDQSIATSKG